MGLLRRMFGENLTTVGLPENEVNIGDRFRIGAVELIVTQLRMPCYKLNARFGGADIVKRFLRSRRTGFHFWGGTRRRNRCGRFDRAHCP
jgi:MOSC domain-containing protein YiiM